MNQNFEELKLNREYKTRVLLYSPGCHTQAGNPLETERGADIENRDVISLT